MGIPEAGGMLCQGLRRPELGPALPFVHCLALDRFFRLLSLGFLSWKMG